MLDELKTWLIQNKELLIAISILLGLIVTYIFRPAKSFFKLLIPKTVRTHRKPKSVYISAPISSAENNLDEYKRVIDEIKIELEKRYKSNVYSCYDEFIKFDSSDSYISSPNAYGAKKVMDEIAKASAFVLILHKRLATSCLIETGVALERGIPISIFYVKGALPWMLQPESLGALASYNIKYFQVNKFDDLPDIIRRERGNLVILP